MTAVPLSDVTPSSDTIPPESSLDTTQPEKPRPAWVDFKLKPLDILRQEITPYSFQQFAVYKSLLQNRFVFGLATGLGKCLGQGTPVLKHDGAIVPVEHIRAGDHLMGPDSQPRAVISTTRGRGPLYRITPHTGESWVCNDVHILTLIHTHQQTIHDISLKDFLALTPSQQRQYQLFQPPEGVDFPSRTTPPFSGYNLGRFTPSDGRLSLDIRSSSRQYRLSLLAGLLDEWAKVRGKAFVIPDPTPQQAELVAFLGRSLGFRVISPYPSIFTPSPDSSSPQYAFDPKTLLTPSRTLYLLGKISTIPTRRHFVSVLSSSIPHNQSPFTATPIGEGDYYGFEIDHDGRFLLGDFTVTHNTMCSYLSYHYFRTKFPTTRMIIVTTKSALLQFRDEHEKFFDHQARIVAVHSEMPRFGAKSYAQARKNAYEFFSSPHDVHKIDVLVLNYAIFRIDHPFILKATQHLNAQKIPVFLIADEATAFKNVSTKTHHAVAAIARRSTKAIGLTATLTKGKLEEIYGIFKGLGVQITANKDEFMDRYCITFAPPNRPHFKSVVGYKNVGEFIERVRPYCVVLRKADVAEFLPPFTIRRIMVEHDEIQFALIRDIYSGVINPDLFTNPTLDPDPFTAPQEIDPFTAPQEIDPTQAFSQDAQSETLDTSSVTIIQRLTEVGHIKRSLQDARLVLKKDLTRFDIKSPKTEELLRLLTDEFTEEKIVVYTPSLQYLKLLKESITREKALPDFYRNPLEISGQVSGQHREENKKTFQEGDTHRLILINDAGLEAINLQSASILVVMSLPRSGGDLVQLAGRISRLGSQHTNLQIIYLITEDSQDEDEYDILNRQMQVMSTVLGEAEVGLIDWGRLKELDRESDDISDEEYRTKTLARLLLFQRKKRASHYRTPKSREV